MTSSRESIQLQKYPLQLAILVSLFWLVTGAAWSADPFSQAVLFYGDKKYDDAEKLLLQHIKGSPKNADAHYYLASCYHHERKFDLAKKEYELVIKNFPNTQAATYSQQALAVLAAPAPAASASAAPASANASAASEANYTPDEEWIPYSRGTGGHFYVRPAINGRQQEMIFDTGAEMTVMGTAQWKQMGMPVPTGPYTTMASGVAGTVGIWRQDVDISLGKIKKHMSLFVMDSPTVPGLLGETFFGDLEYNMDSRAGYIHFFKKGHAAGANALPYNSIDIPFRHIGANMLITARVNGVPIDCIFDTGASSVLFGANHLRQLGLHVPSDARVGMSGGVGGGMMVYGFPVNTLEVGDLRKSNFEVSVSSIPQSVPLIGQSFFGDRKYVIDNEKMLIRFAR